ncbi:hypothetical protein KJZ67_04525 [Patescibacteria group bacterium]|nr:hypothetical protein [Patescibacteria group bacterium]
MGDTLIYKSNGLYLGFIRNGFLYSRDGVYMGWLENDFVWDANGQFKGVLLKIGDYSYILTKRFTLKPTPRTPRIASNQAAIPNPPSINPISLPVELMDAY